MSEPDLTAPVRIAKSGRSFDFAGYRVRLEGSAHDANDQVPEVVEFIVEAITAYQHDLIPKDQP